MNRRSSDISIPETPRPENVTGEKLPSVAVFDPIVGASTIHSAEVEGPE